MRFTVVSFRFIELDTIMKKTYFGHYELCSSIQFIFKIPELIVLIPIIGDLTQ